MPEQTPGFTEINMQYSPMQYNPNNPTPAQTPVTPRQNNNSNFDAHSVDLGSMLPQEHSHGNGNRDARRNNDTNHEHVVINIKDCEKQHRTATKIQDIAKHGKSFASRKEEHERQAMQVAPTQQGPLKKSFLDQIKANGNNHYYFAVAVVLIALMYAALFFIDKLSRGCKDSNGSYADLAPQITEYFANLNLTATDSSKVASDVLKIGHDELSRNSDACNDKNLWISVINYTKTIATSAMIFVGKYVLNANKADLKEISNIAEKVKIKPKATLAHLASSSSTTNQAIAPVILTSETTNYTGFNEHPVNHENIPPKANLGNNYRHNNRT